jgi:plasmid stabilization system protein ParE
MVRHQCERQTRRAALDAVVVAACGWADWRADLPDDEKGMARLRLSDHVLDDLARIADHLLAHEVVDVDIWLAGILGALAILVEHPLIGRKAAHGRRELVIGRGSRGHVALYAYDPLDDVVAVAALRAQREAGFGD